MSQLHLHFFSENCTEMVKKKSCLWLKKPICGKIEGRESKYTVKLKTYKINWTKLISLPFQYSFLKEKESNINTNNFNAAFI